MNKGQMPTTIQTFSKSTFTIYIFLMKNDGLVQILNWTEHTNDHHGSLKIKKQSNLVYTFTKNQLKWTFTNHLPLRQGNKPQENFKKERKHSCYHSKELTNWGPAPEQFRESWSKLLEIWYKHFKCIIHNVLVQNLYYVTREKQPATTLKGLNNLTGNEVRNLVIINKWKLYPQYIKSFYKSIEKSFLPKKSYGLAFQRRNTKG